MAGFVASKKKQCKSFDLQSFCRHGLLLKPDHTFYILIVKIPLNTVTLGV